MSVDHAVAELISALKTGDASGYGYDVCPLSFSHFLARRDSDGDPRTENGRVKHWRPLIEEAAWALTRRGILRPGVNGHSSQATSDGGYSLTAEGADRVADLDESTLLLCQPDSLSLAFSSYSTKYGKGFEQRALEAVRCRQVEAWLACCSMAGAAAESILLAVAIAKTGEEESILKTYQGARGRSKILDKIVGASASHIRGPFKDFAGIISMWRDEASHGKASSLNTANADEALRQLLHMCQWVDREWAKLTEAPGSK